MPLAVILRSHDFQQENKIEIARKRLEIREKLCKETLLGNRGRILRIRHELRQARPLAAVSRSRDF